MSLQAVGRRIYFTGNTYSIKDRIKGIGGKWDADRRQWWVGSGKRAEAESLVGSLAESGGESGSSGERDDAKVYSKVEYKGKTYYQTASTKDGLKYRLASLDGKIAFWAATDQCQVIRRYSAREERGAYGRPTGRMVYQTLGGLRKFISDRREEESQVRSGQVPNGWCLDLEDGCVKPRHECDMPAD